MKEEQEERKKREKTATGEKAQSVSMFYSCRAFPVSGNNGGHGSPLPAPWPFSVALENRAAGGERVSGEMRFTLAHSRACDRSEKFRPESRTPFPRRAISARFSRTVVPPKMRSRERALSFSQERAEIRLILTSILISDLISSPRFSIFNISLDAGLRDTRFVSFPESFFPRSSLFRPDEPSFW